MVPTLVVECVGICCVWSEHELERVGSIPEGFGVTCENGFVAGGVVTLGSFLRSGEVERMCVAPDDDECVRHATREVQLRRLNVVQIERNVKLRWLEGIVRVWPNCHHNSQSLRDESFC